MSFLSKLFRRQESDDPLERMMSDFWKQGDEFDRILERAEKRPEIRSLLAKYSLDLSNGGLEVTRGQIEGRNTDTLQQITDIYWRLKAAGAGEEIAEAVISRPEYLTMYLEMKADKVTDVPVAMKLMEIL